MLSVSQVQRKRDKDLKTNRAGVRKMKNAVSAPCISTHTSERVSDMQREVRMGDRGNKDQPCHTEKH